MKQTKRILSMVLCLLMLIAVVPVMEASAASYTINGKTVSASDFDSSPGECWMYAKNIYRKIWGDIFTNEFSSSDNYLRNKTDEELTLTLAHLKQYVSEASLGSCLRICNNDYLHVNSDKKGHSQIIVQKDSNGFTVLEGGLSSEPYRREHYYTWSEYMSKDWLTKYKYIKYSRKLYV